MSIRNRIASLMLAAAAVFSAMSSASAQEKLVPLGKSAATLTDGTEPVLIITLGSINKLMMDVEYLTGVAGQPQAGGMFRMLAGTFTQGINMDEPIGVIMPLVNGAPEPLITIPTTDIRTVLKRLEAQTGPVDELDDGTLVVTVNQNTVYVKQGQDWAVAGRNRDVLKLAPSDPKPLFTGMGNAYGLALRVKVQQVPPPIRDQLISQMRQGFEQAMRQQSNTEEQAREMAESTLSQLEQVIQEADELNIGWNVDQDNRRIVLDFAFSAVPGSNMASIYGGQKAIPSRFASVIRDDVAGFYHAAVSISPEAVKQTQDSIGNSFSMMQNAIANENNLSEEQTAEVEEMLDRFNELMLETISEGKIDMGLLVLADANQFRAVTGMFVSDGEKAKQFVKDLAAKVPANKPKAPKFTFDVSTYNGVSMHLIEADVPESEDEVRSVFGDKIQIRIGTAEKAVYIALGRDSEELLKNFIDSDASGTTAKSLAELRIKLLPILQFAQSVEDNDDIAAVITELSSAPDQGEFRVISTPIPNGGSSQVTIGEGIIKAIGAAATANQRRQAAPF